MPNKVKSIVAYSQCRKVEDGYRPGVILSMEDENDLSWAFDTIEQASNFADPYRGVGDQTESRERGRRT